MLNHFPTKSIVGKCALHSLKHHLTLKTKMWNATSIWKGKFLTPTKFKPICVVAIDLTIINRHGFVSRSYSQAACDPNGAQKASPRHRIKQQSDKKNMQTDTVRILSSVRRNVRSRSFASSAFPLFRRGRLLQRSDPCPPETSRREGTRTERAPASKCGLRPGRPIIRRVPLWGPAWQGSDPQQSELCSRRRRRGV